MRLQMLNQGRQLEGIPANLPAQSVQAWQEMVVN